MIAIDCAAAGVGVETSDGSIDFHALRHTFVTALARSGVHPKDAQTLARHSTITLTMDTYTHASLSSLTAAVEKLPAMSGGSKAVEAAKATGTDGTAGPRLVRQLVGNPVRRGPEPSAPVRESDEKPADAMLASGDDDSACHELSAADRESASGPRRTRTSNQRIMSPLL